MQRPLLRYEPVAPLGSHRIRIAEQLDLIRNLFELCTGGDTPSSITVDRRHMEQYDTRKVLTSVDAQTSLDEKRKDDADTSEVRATSKRSNGFVSDVDVEPVARQKPRKK